MGAWPEDVDWGDWVLGDLADILDRISDLVGRSAAVQRVLVAPPFEPDTLPSVTIVVPDEGGIFRLRRELASCEYTVRFLGGSSERSLRAEVAGIDIEVVLEGGESR